MLLNAYKQECINCEKLPLVIMPEETMDKEAFAEFLRGNSDLLWGQVLAHGGVLLRGFPLSTAQDFAEAIENLGFGSFIEYIGGDSPRHKVYGEIYTSTEAPPSVKIALHNELSYVKNYPRHIYFFCEVAPKVGGSTIIADARKIAQSIDPDVKKRFIEKGIRYTSNYPRKGSFIHKINPSHKVWNTVLDTDDKEVAEERCRENGIDYRWTKGDWIELTQTLPATLNHPETGEEIWFNQAHLFDFNPKVLNVWHYIGTKVLYARKHTLLHAVSFADGTPIPRSDLYHILDVLNEHTIAFPWQRGDMLVLDNILTMHGRERFERPRRILTAMTGR